MITVEKNSAPCHSDETAIHRFPCKLSSSIILTSLIVLQFALFCIHLRTHITDFAAVYIDQVNTYLFAYRSHYDFLAGGIQSIINDPETPTNLKAMKGPLVPLAAFLSTFFLGVNRFAVAQVNFVFFVIAEIALFCFIQKRASKTVAFGALGAFLLTGTHFAQFGGINDLRLDYGAMVAMLLAFTAFSNLLEKKDLPSMILFIATMVLGSFTRVILLAYWLGAEIIMLGILCVGRVIRHAPQKNSTSVILLLATINTFGVFAVHTTVFWRELFGYYGACKLSGEYLMRMKEFGATSLFDVLTYYPKSFWLYFGLVFTLTAAIVLVGRLQREKSTFLAAIRWTDNKYIYTLFPCITLSVMICASLYSPSPVVIGVLAGPVAIFCVLIAIDSLSSYSSYSNKQFIAITLLIIGQLWFCKEAISPTYAPHAAPESAIASKQILKSLVDTASDLEQKPHVLYWAITHDEINEYNFKIFWYELKQRALPRQLVQHALAWYPETSFEEIQAKLERADTVVVPISLSPLPPGYFEYPGVTSIRKHLSKISAILDSKFQQQHVVHIKSWGTVAVFKHQKPTLQKLQPKTGER